MLLLSARVTPAVHVLVLLFTFQIAGTGAEVIANVASYEPPAFLDPHKPRTDPGDDIFPEAFPALEYLSRDNRESHFRQLDIGRQVIGRTIGQGYRVTYRSVTEEDTKERMTQLMAKRATNAPKVEEITFAGHKAFRLYCVVPMPQIHEGIVFRFEHIWVPIQPNWVVTLQLVGSDDELLKTVRDSLSTFKVLPGAFKPTEVKDPELHVAKDAVQLGDERGKVVKACGRTIHDGPSNSLFYDGNYLISVDYRMYIVTSISYARSTDVRQWLKAMANPERDQRDLRLDLRLPLQRSEIEILLARHEKDTAGKKLIWKSTEENGWERNDGVKAGYHPEFKMLVIASKEDWDKQLIFRK